MPKEIDLKAYTEEQDRRWSLMSKKVTLLEAEQQNLFRRLVFLMKKLDIQPDPDDAD